MSAQAAASAQPRRRTRPIDCLAGEIVPVRPSPHYVFWLFLAAAGMIVLPLVYFGLIAGVGYAVYYHLTHHMGPLTRAGFWVALIGYYGPAVIGGIVLIFLIKPLFRRGPRWMDGLKLDRALQPQIFEYVARVAEVVGAPAPREIKLNCDANASASFRRGWLSMFGNDLTLTIGLPLVSAMSLRQFTGVIAHELGHFSQGVGMRLSYIIRFINGWFARIVYERDSFDEGLERFAVTNELRLGWFLQVSRLFVWLSRRVLWVLMMGGHVISSFLLRQMEYDADRYEVRVAGSEAFRETWAILERVHAASQLAHGELYHCWRAQRLPDDVPAYVKFKLDTLPEKTLAEIAKAGREQRTRTFDTHPSPADRIRQSDLEAAQGIMRGDLPATALFRDYATLCRTISCVHYSDLTLGAFDTKCLAPAEAVIREQRQSGITGQPIVDYFCHELDLWRPVLLREAELHAPADPKQTLSELRELRAAIRATAPSARAAYERYREASQNYGRAMCAAALSRARVSYRPADFGLERASEPAAQAAQSAAGAALAAARAELIAFEKLVCARMIAALRLLCVPQVMKRVSDGKALCQDARNLMQLLTRLETALAGCLEFRRDAYLMGTALKRLQEKRNAQNTVLESIFRARLESAFAFADARRRELRDVLLPFTNEGGSVVTVGQFLGGDELIARDAQSALRLVYSFGEGLSVLYQRCMGRLAFIALETEAALRRAAAKPAAAEAA